MKKLLLLLLTITIVSELQAKVLTVSNRQGATEQFKDVPSAITAATAGDTIYIHGSEAMYESFYIDKRLTIIGPGHNPRSSSALAANLRQVMFQWGAIDASGSSFIGLTINEFRSEYAAQNAITIKRCSISSYINAVGSSEWIIENNIINSIYGSPNNFIIRNNIFTGIIRNSNSCVISNNIFIGGQEAFSDVNQGIIENNIFYESTPLGASNSNFNNNITFSSANATLPYGTNSGNLNKVNMDPLFTTYPGGVFSYDHDYHLKASSPGKNAGTDGTDIGIYGGMGFSETGEPPIPVVRSFSIQNGVLAPNGKLKIRISAEAKN